MESLGIGASERRKDRGVGGARGHKVVQVHGRKEEGGHGGCGGVSEFLCRQEANVRLFG